MSELPKGWVESSLIDLAKFIDYRGRTPKKTEMGIPLITAKNIKNGFINREPKEFIAESDYDSWMTRGFPKKGDVLLTTEAPLGNVAQIDIEEKFALAQRAICFQFYEKGIERFLYYYLRSPFFNQELGLNSTGSTVKGIKAATLKKLPVHVAPLNEQKRIVEKLDEVLAQVDTIKARLDGIPAILKRFRQSVLATAVSGKLTEEWRGSSNSSAENDLTKELLENTAKTRKVEQTSSHELVVNKFPSAWRKTTFTELYKFIDYRGKTPKKSENGFRLYTAKNIKMGFVSNEPVEYLSESDYEAWMTRGFSRLGDIFFVTEGHTMGCTAINDLGSEIALAQRTLTLQPYGNVNTRFHHYYMMSDSFQKLVDLNATGSAAKGIKAAKFRGLPLPFPSYEEQNEIVRLVDQYFAFADTIEAQVKKAQTRVDNLTQSILAKAFRGELVPQDPNDEPADKLLERIAATRKEADALAKAAKKAQSTKSVAKKKAAKSA
ncbi:TPA: restriction endonuclease subunit S [Photobacterium damselae]